MSDNQSPEQPDRHLEHLQMVYAREKKELREMQTKRRALEAELSHLHSKNLQRQTRINKQVSDILFTSADCEAKEIVIMKTLQDYSNLLQKVDDCEEETKKVRSEVKAEFKKTLAEINDESIILREINVSIKVKVLEEHLSKREIVYKKMEEHFQSEKEKLQNARMQYYETNIKLETQIGEAKLKVLQLQYEKGIGYGGGETDKASEENN